MLFMKNLCWIPLLIFTLIYLTLLVLGAVNIRWNFYTRSFNKASGKKMVALTFDDGPSIETSRILDILKREKVEAAFFCIGKNVQSQPELIKRWEEENHLIGNHSYNHGFHFDWKSAVAMREEIEKTNKTIENITGKKPRLFRPPYGVTNPNLAKAIKSSQMHSIGWSVRSYDTTARDPEKLLARILKQTNSGDVILLHDSMKITADILTDLIAAIRSKGFSFARVDKLFDLQPYE